MAIKNITLKDEYNNTLYPQTKFKNILDVPQNIKNAGIASDIHGSAYVDNNTSGFVRWDGNITDKESIKVNLVEDGSQWTFVKVSDTPIKYVTPLVGETRSSINWSSALIVHNECQVKPATADEFDPFYNFSIKRYVQTYNEIGSTYLATNNKIILFSLCEYGEFETPITLIDDNSPMCALSVLEDTTLFGKTISKGLWLWYDNMNYYCQALVAGKVSLIDPMLVNQNQSWNLAAHSTNEKFAIQWDGNTTGKSTIQVDSVKYTKISNDKFVCGINFNSMISENLDTISGMNWFNKKANWGIHLKDYDSNSAYLQGSDDPVGLIIKNTDNSLSFSEKYEYFEDYNNENIVGIYVCGLFTSEGAVAPSAWGSPEDVFNAVAIITRETSAASIGTYFMYNVNLNGHSVFTSSLDIAAQSENNYQLYPEAIMTSAEYCEGWSLATSGGKATWVKCPGYKHTLALGGEKYLVLWSPSYLQYTSYAIDLSSFIKGFIHLNEQGIFQVYSIDTDESIIYYLDSSGSLQQYTYESFEEELVE